MPNELVGALVIDQLVACLAHFNLGDWSEPSSVLQHFMSVSNAVWQAWSALDAYDGNALSTKAMLDKWGEAWALFEKRQKDPEAVLSVLLENSNLLYNLFEFHVR